MKIRTGSAKKKKNRQVELVRVKRNNQGVERYCNKRESSVNGEGNNLLCVKGKLRQVLQE